MNDMNNHQVNFQSQVIPKIAKVRTKEREGEDELHWIEEGLNTNDSNSNLSQDLNQGNTK